MKAIVCEEPNVLKWTDADMPSTREEDALVKVKRIGICGTDLHAFKGNQPFFNYPRVLGHELAGVIESNEDNPHGLKKGDRVAVIPYIDCGECSACRRGLKNCCTRLNVLGVHLDGGMCEYLSVPGDHLVKANDLTLDQAAILEPLSIGAHAVRRSGLQANDVVLVIGGGPIGLGVMAIAKQKGAKVIAMDISESRLEFCRQWANVDITVNAQDNPLETVTDLTNGDMPVIVFDATGNRESMMDAFHYPAQGGKLIYVGLVKADITFSDPDFHAKELTLMASRNATREDFTFVLKSIRNGYIDASTYITHRVHFDQLIDEFENWLKPESGVVKAMVEL